MVRIASESSPASVLRFPGGCWRTCEGDGHPPSAKGVGGVSTKTISSVAGNGRVASSLSSVDSPSAMQLKSLPETPEQAMPAVDTTEGEQEDMLG